MTLASSVAAFLIALAAGAFGSVLGIGGGLFIIPSLNLFLGIKLKVAIAASIVAIIATSLGGGNVYVRRHVADVRLGLVLALATAPAAVLGASLATQVSPRVLAGAFALVLGVSASRTLGSIGGAARSESGTEQGQPGSALRFRGAYREDTTGKTVRYEVIRVPAGVAASSLAGLVSGLLGVGGGIVQVPIMHLVMKVPIKVATTTSTYIIGITAMAGAFVYYNHQPSFVDPSLAVPVTIGVFVGASLGSNLLGRVNQTTLQQAFVVVLALYAVQMTLRVFGIGGE